MSLNLSDDDIDDNCLSFSLFRKLGNCSVNSGHRLICAIDDSSSDIEEDDNSHHIDIHRPSEVSTNDKCIFSHINTSENIKKQQNAKNFIATPRVRSSSVDSEMSKSVSKRLRTSSFSYQHTKSFVDNRALNQPFAYSESSLLKTSDNTQKQDSKSITNHLEYKRSVITSSLTG